MTALKSIIIEAKKLKKKFPKKEWKDLVKQASIIYKGKHKRKSTVEKKKIVSGVKKKAVKKTATKKPVKKSTGSYHKDTKSHNVRINVVSGKLLNGFFDTTVIKDIDALKKQYFKLAKIYHPDAGGTTAQFQQLGAEYERLLKSLLQGSDLNKEQQENELIIDQAIKQVIDEIIILQNINIELIGKWLWVSGNTYPVHKELKKAGLVFIKKEGKPYWVYKGIESSSRGGTSIEQIRQKYGTYTFNPVTQKKISGITTKNINKTKLVNSLKRLTKALNKRPI